MKRFKIFLIYILVFLVVIPLTIEVLTSKRKQDLGFSIDLDKIRQRGRLIAVTDISSSSYFIYNGRPMGFQYEMLRYFASQLGVEFEIIPCNSIDEAFHKLNNGLADVITMNLTVTKEREKAINFTIPFSKTRQVLVQRQGNKYRNAISSIHDLDGRCIYVSQGSAYIHQLQKIMQDEIINFKIVETDVLDDEQLTEKVAKGEIDFTITDENMALVNQVYYPNIDITVSLCDKQELAWAVRKDSPQLQTMINQWLLKFKKTTEFAVIYQKYFSTDKAAQRDKCKYWSVRSQRISPYDGLIKKYSRQIGWDWRLLAALIYQESCFDPTISSHAGAYGLMQIMPVTASRFGIENYQTPELNIKAGVKFIQYLDQYFIDSIPNKDERIKFILASYNAGARRVLDARRLAEKNGNDPNVWKNSVDYYLLHRSKNVLYSEGLILRGYCIGSESYNYVNQVLSQYRHYRNWFPE